MISNGGWSLAEGCPNREGCSKQMLKKAPTLSAGDAVADGPWQPPSLATVVAPQARFRGRWNAAGSSLGKLALRPPLMGSREGGPSLVLMTASHWCCRCSSPAPREWAIPVQQEVEKVGFDGAPHALIDAQRSRTHS
jgi:hypothetical protein